MRLISINVTFHQLVDINKRAYAKTVMSKVSFVMTSIRKREKHRKRCCINHMLFDTLYVFTHYVFIHHFEYINAHILNIRFVWSLMIAVNVF